MRFPTAPVLLALPVLAIAESPFQQYQAKFQNFLSSFGSYIPSNDKPAAEEAAASSPPPAAADVAEEATDLREPKVSVLTLENWKDTLYSPVSPDALEPEEWWVFVTGGNTTCKGFCGQAETAWNETVKKFATVPNTPHMGYLDCENENILCHALGCGAGSIWVFDMLPPPAEVNIYAKRLNLSSIATDDIVELQASGSREKFTRIEGFFHPFNGKVAEYGLTVPMGYFGYYFSLVPNWLFMFLLSAVSRMMMSKRMQGAGAGGAGGAGGAPAAAPAAGAS